MTRGYIQQVYDLIYQTDKLVVQTCREDYHSWRREVNPNLIFRDNHNHRKIANCELVFDIDCNDPQISRSVYQHISDNLIVDNVSHSVWFTSRTYHIHAFYRNLWLFPEEDRKIIRRLMLGRYAQEVLHWIDKGECSDKRMIRDFGGIHETTGKPCVCVYNHGLGILPLLNPIRPEILNEFKEKVKPSNPVTIVNPRGDNGLPEAQKKKLEGLLRSAQETRFTKTGMNKNNTYFKNLAIASLLLGLTEEQVKPIFKTIAQNNPPHEPIKILSWYRGFSKSRDQGKHIEVNWRELEGFYNA